MPNGLVHTRADITTDVCELSSNGCAETMSANFYVFFLFASSLCEV